MVVPLVVVMVVVVGLEGAMARQDDGLNYAELGKMDVMDGFGNLDDLVKSHNCRYILQLFMIDYFS